MGEAVKEDSRILETRALKGSWEKHSLEHLDNYLVSDLEDPRINPQSILTRALLIDSLWPSQLTEVIDAELRFGTVMSWLVGQLRAGHDRNELLHAAAAGEGRSMPSWVSETYHWLQEERCPVPDYISGALTSLNWGQPDRVVAESVLDTFANLWRAELWDRSAAPLAVIEPACGSANDYRFLHSCGLADHLRYVGFDLSEKNIFNAKTRFPEEDFFVGNLFEPPLGDASCDYLFVHDLFEHLSLAGLECALREAMRLTRKQAWLHFFNVKDVEAHEVKTVESYHWNLLSLAQLRASLEGQAARVQVLRMPQFLHDKFGCNHYHNPEAVTLVVTK